MSSWGDSYGNRVDRFLAATAYLDGRRPSVIMARGYYTRTVITAWDWRDGRLTERWRFDTNDSGNSAYAGQGNHQMSVADVDGDGRDEIVYGAMAVDDNGARLWNTGQGHGDAMHVGDLDPARPGLEEFKVDESTSKYPAWFADARTGQILWRQPDCACDNGRGVAADVYAGSPGAESWSSGVSGLYDVTGRNIGRKPSSGNFLSWWGRRHRPRAAGRHPHRQVRHRRRHPAADRGRRPLQQRHQGDARALRGTSSATGAREVVWPTGDNRALRIYSTPYQTGTRITTLLQDTQYRTALAWQNTGYNQPPHPSFFIGNAMPTPPRPSVYTP